MDKIEFHDLIEAISFGLTDGIICFLGIIVGVAAATRNPTLVIVATISGGIADALGNSVGFFVSQSTERAKKIHDVRDHGIETQIHTKS
jgi:hypothetical protein